MFESLQLKQENVLMYMTKMKISELEKYSVVKRYNATNETDYQRPPMPAHYRKIAKYFMTESKPILPSAIIAAMGKDDYEYDGTNLIIKNKIRIVDGQHRIEGMKCLKEGYSKNSIDRYKELNETFDLPVIIMVIEDPNDLIEIDAFINLNSKGKKVRTDLAVALKNKKTKSAMDNSKCCEVDDDIKLAISMEVSNKLNGNPTSKWYGLIIQADEVGNRNEQPISIIAFSRSIRPIVDRYCELKLNNQLCAEKYEEVVDDICGVIENAWKCVEERWSECFNDDGSYNSSYNICKGIGVNTLFGVFSEVYDNNVTGYDNFKEILNKTEIDVKDWLVGGTFTGYASYQGFSLIKKLIKGQLSRNEF